LAATTGRAATRRQASADRTTVCDLAPADACCRGTSGRAAVTSLTVTSGRAVSTGLAAVRDRTEAFRMWVVVATIPSPRI